MSFGVSFPNIYIYMTYKLQYKFLHSQSLRCNCTLAVCKWLDLSSRISSVIHFEQTEVRLHLLSSSFLVFLQMWQAQVTRPEQGVLDGLRFLRFLYSKLATTTRLLRVEIGPSATSSFVVFFCFFGQVPHSSVNCSLLFRFNGTGNGRRL